ncbi:hypothetical protein Taro_001918 [Colocasia esculenta]|uniref:Retrotransposon gag domain-containing protein n=1 Tax=Colocasia esculenta TaxID=4460 RepID=A0A843TM67_COLES|nr:hypothetical protein [Colocasia esculenta]
MANVPLHEEVKTLIKATPSLEFEPFYTLAPIFVLVLPLLLSARRVSGGGATRSVIPFDLIMDGGDANWRKMESSMHDLTRVMKDARAWWETVETTLEDSNQVSWEEFVELFNEQYFSEVVQEKKENEFVRLKQLRMSVSEYEAQFARSSKYAPHLISTEKLKAKRFMSGLRPHFITQLTPHLITTYSEMVKRALALEAANETVDKIRGKSGEGSSDRKRKYESGNAPKIQQTTKKVIHLGMTFKGLSAEWTH